jgi:hypothetical protein
VNKPIDESSSRTPPLMQRTCALAPFAVTRDFLNRERSDGPSTTVTRPCELPLMVQDQLQSQPAARSDNRTNLFEQFVAVADRP